MATEHLREHHRERMLFWAGQYELAERQVGEFRYLVAEVVREGAWLERWGSGVVDSLDAMLEFRAYLESKVREHRQLFDAAIGGAK